MSGQYPHLAPQNPALLLLPLLLPQRDSRKDGHRQTDRRGGPGQPPGQQEVDGSLELLRPFPRTSYFWEATALVARTWEQGCCAMSGFFHGVAPNRKKTVPKAFLEPCLQASSSRASSVQGNPLWGPTGTWDPPWWHRHPFPYSSIWAR